MCLSGRMPHYPAMGEKRLNGIEGKEDNALDKDGVLEIRFPKTEEAKRKEVKIRVE